MVGEKELEVGKIDYKEIKNLIIGKCWILVYKINLLLIELKGNGIGRKIIYILK